MITNNNFIEPLFFSVIIPAYNAEKFIEKTLLSVINQTFLNFEVIVTNDGSTDNTQDVVEKFIKKYPNYLIKIINQSNNGIASARNTAINNSNGLYLAFLDADDIWYSDKLKKSYYILLNERHIDVLYHNEVEINRGKRKVTNYNNLESPQYFNLLLNGNCLSTSATVVKATSSKLVNNFTENKIFNSAEDYDYWLKLAYCNQLIFHNTEILGEYHRGESSISNKILYHVEACFQVQSFHLHNFIDKYPTNKKCLDKINNLNRDKYYTIARSLYREKNIKKAIKFYCKTLNIDILHYKSYIGILQAVLKFKFK
jgi:teichuronic acid biosynthesis glycosyltransferase TuaG